MLPQALSDNESDDDDVIQQSKVSNRKRVAVVTDSDSE